MSKTFLTIMCFILATGAALCQTIVVDNPSATFNGTWSTATSATNKYGSDFRYSSINTSGTSTATYTPSIPTTDSRWYVYTWYPTVSNAYSATQHIIHHASGDTTVNVNQTTNAGKWVSLGQYTLNAGTGNYVRITNYGTNTSKRAVADAVRFLLDITPPVVSNVSAQPGTNSAIITWTTDEPATSQVEYGPDTNYGNQTTKDTTLVTNHSVTITGLTPSRLYHYRVKSDDAYGNSAVSNDYTFQTAMPPKEFRAVWADTWHDGILSADQVTALVNTLSAYNYNVVIPEVRKCGDAYYDSAYEPRATNIIDPPPFDPLADLITKAHAAGIEVHPWIVTYRIWNSGWGNAPAGHVWTLHPEWAMTDVNGYILDGNYYNLDPGVPGAQDYIYKVVMDIVTRYDVDGFNFDYIRYPTGYTWGYNSITRQRFYDEYGFWPPTSTSDPNWEVWAQYRRQQVTDLVKKCYCQIMAVKPHVKLSVDSVGWMGSDPNTNYTDTRQYKEVYQDSQGWMQNHIVDINILMNYKREYDTTQAPDYRLWANWLDTCQTNSGRHGVDGQAAYLNSITDSVTQMSYDRSIGLSGMCNYSYAVTNKDGQPASSFWSAVKSNLYQDAVQTPDMPWKSNPTTGMITGTVTNGANPNDPIYRNWIYKATVTATGPVTRSAQTDATGFYGILDLPPGTYTLTCEKAGFPPVTYQNQTVAAGQVLKCNFVLGYVNKISPYGLINPGWNLISLPNDPIDPDPAVVFNGIEIDNNLSRWDPMTTSFVTYDPWAPSNFGECKVGEGYYLFADGMKTFTYQAYSNNASSRDVVLPKAGWTLIGHPLPQGKLWANTQVTYQGQTVSLATARDNGWINSVGWWLDSTSQSLQTVGLPDDFPTSEYLWAWYGYWIQSYRDNITLTIQ